MPPNRDPVPLSTGRSQRTSARFPLEVKIYRHVNTIRENRICVLNGLGGSGDFTWNALLTIITLPSTAVGGDVSQIIPMVLHVDRTEHDIVITERGVADLWRTYP